MSFRTLVTRSVRWRPVAGGGLEHLTARHVNGSIVARSVVIGARGGAPYGVSYTIVCDTGWRVRSLDLTTTDNRRLQLTSDGAGHWSGDGGQPLPQFDGCIDVDLAGTPFTNTLPIRRLDLEVGSDAVALSMVYVPFDTLSPKIDGQSYRCLQPGRLYRYQALDRSFAADLSVDGDGLVIDYPTLFERVES
jgi:uncharacterized protein